MGAVGKYLITIGLIYNHYLTLTGCSLSVVSIKVQRILFERCVWLCVTRSSVMPWSWVMCRWRRQLHSQQVCTLIVFSSPPTSHQFSHFLQELLVKCDYCDLVYKRLEARILLYKTSNFMWLDILLYLKHVFLQLFRFKVNRRDHALGTSS